MEGASGAYTAEEVPASDADTEDEEEDVTPLSGAQDISPRVKSIASKTPLQGFIISSPLD